jgi:hypothetical protein
MDLLQMMQEQPMYKKRSRGAELMPLATGL